MTVQAQSPTPDCPHLLAGRDALARGAWEAARASFEAALADRETTEALEGLAVAALGVSDFAAAMDAHERAFALHRERGDRRAAARAALALMFEARSLRGDAALGDGWLERARELLEGLGSVPERGWLLVRLAETRHLPAHDTGAALRLLAEARAIAREHGEASLEMEALAHEGSARLRAGEVVEGLRRLDQAAAAAAAGEVGDLFSTGSIFCQVLSAYDKVRDYDRAAQWSETFQALTARGRVRSLGSLCRNYFAGLLIARGRWTEAEAALAVGPVPVPWVAQRSLVRLGELRLRQGRFDEAEALFRRVAHHPEAKLGLATLALERGDARAAGDLVERQLRQLMAASPFERARAHSLAARVNARLGRFDEAARCVAELEALAAAAGTPGLRASARHVAGELAKARGDREAAREAFEDAVDDWARAGMPFERAAARLCLARELAATGREPAALEEAARAREEFGELGAPHGVAEAGELERSLAPAAPGDAPPRPLLSAREREVLGLVAQGLSNKEVAARLFLSEHTIKRHLANILTRLELPSRAAAAAWAVKQQLV